MSTIKWFKGVPIFSAGVNSSGIRWTASVNETRLRADTLAGIRALIADALKGRTA